MPRTGSISSLHNPQLRAVERLKSKRRDRYRERQFVAEGHRLIRHALSRGHHPASLYFTPAYAATAEGAALIEALLQTETPVWEVTPEAMAAISDTVTPQGVVGVYPMLSAPADVWRAAEIVLVLDALRTPGNVGTILRTALATGVGAVVCAPGTVDPYSPKVVRGAMGAHWDLPILPDAPWEAIRAGLEGRAVYGADAGGALSLWDADLAGRIALIVGSEAAGLSAEARALAGALVSIPMATGAESLNAGIAAAALMFEAQRQRR